MITPFRKAPQLDRLSNKILVFIFIMLLSKKQMPIKIVSVL